MFELLNIDNWNVFKCKIDLESSAYAKAVDQSNRKCIYTMASSQSGEQRSSGLKFQKQLMGTLAEIFVEEFIRKIISESDLTGKWAVERYDDIRTDDFKSPAGEFDISAHRINNTEKFFRFESRSSIAYDRSLNDALNQFDIIGPYISSAKHSEKYNDFYIRPLYSYSDYIKKSYCADNFETLLKEGKISLYLAGGCSKEDLIKKGYCKSMKQGGSVYLVIKIKKASDILQFSERFSKALGES